MEEKEITPSSNLTAEQIAGFKELEAEIEGDYCANEWRATNLYEALIEAGDTAWADWTLQKIADAADNSGILERVAEKLKERGETNRFLATAKKAEAMANTTNKNKLISSWKYNYYVEQIRRTFHVKKNKKDFRIKKHENFIITSLIHDERLRDLKPLTQHYVPLANNNYALIDLYYPQIELAIEVDEPHHLDNIDQDKERQEKIEDLIQCDFRRFAISTEDNEFNTKLFSDIETVKREMIDKINELKRNNVFEEWKPIETLDIEEAKEKYTNTLFIKIKGEFEPEVMYNRYRGRWRLSKKKLPHIKQVIVVHDRVVSKVFLNPVFKRFEEDNKMYFEAEEDSNNEIIGNNITNWEYENSRAYSNDIEQLIKKKK